MLDLKIQEAQRITKNLIQQRRKYRTPSQDYTSNRQQTQSSLSNSAQINQQFFIDLKMLSHNLQQIGTRGNPPLQTLQQPSFANGSMPSEPRIMKKQSEFALLVSTQSDEGAEDLKHSQKIVVNKRNHLLQNVYL